MIKYIQKTHDFYEDPNLLENDKKKEMRFDKKIKKYIRQNINQKSGIYSNYWANRKNRANRRHEKVSEVYQKLESCKMYSNSALKRYLEVYLGLEMALETQVLVSSSLSLVHMQKIRVKCI